MRIQQAWVCNVCKKRLELLAKTGQWYHGGQARPVGLDLDVTSDASSIKTDVSPPQADGGSYGDPPSLSGDGVVAATDGVGRQRNDQRHAGRQSRNNSEDRRLSPARSMGESDTRRRDSNDGRPSSSSLRGDERDAPPVNGRRGDNRSDSRLARENSLDGGGNQRRNESRGGDGRNSRISTGSNSDRMRRARSVDHDREAVDDNDGRNGRNSSRQPNSPRQSDSNDRRNSPRYSDNDRNSSSRDLQSPRTLSKERNNSSQRERQSPRIFDKVGNSPRPNSRQTPDRDAELSSDRLSPRSSRDNRYHGTEQRGPNGPINYERSSRNDRMDDGGPTSSRSDIYNEPISRSVRPDDRGQRYSSNTDLRPAGTGPRADNKQWERQPERLMRSGDDRPPYGGKNYGSDRGSYPESRGSVSPSRRTGYRDERMPSDRYPEPLLRRNHLDPSAALSRNATRSRRPLDETLRNDSLSSDPSDIARAPAVRVHKHGRRGKSGNRQGSLSSSDDELQTTSECTSCEDQEVESESISERGIGESHDSFSL